MRLIRDHFALLNDNNDYFHCIDKIEDFNEYWNGGLYPRSYVIWLKKQEKWPFPNMDAIDGVDDFGLFIWIT